METEQDYEKKRKYEDGKRFLEMTLQMAMFGLLVNGGGSQTPEVVSRQARQQAEALEKERSKMIDLYETINKF